MSEEERPTSEQGRSLDCRGRHLVLDRTRLMGVVNVTPDSFSDGGQFLEADRAVAQARRLVSEGADLIDIGGESSRPGARPLALEEELDRVLPVFEQLSDLEVPLSIDTYKPQVARAAVEAGAHLINDISGGGEAMLELAAELGVPVVVMHMQGQPATMQRAPAYRDVAGEVLAFLRSRLEVARQRGVEVILDPGIGFGKTLEHNLELLRQLPRFRALGAPLLVGLSRKSFLGKLTGRPVDERLAAGLAAQCHAALSGADILRVHDVAPTADALEIVEALRSRERSRIVLQKLRAKASIGVTEEERQTPQTIEVDLEVNVDIGPAASSDSLGTTLDYDRLAALVRRVCEGERRLLERLAEDLAAAVLGLNGVHGVRVFVSKPGVAQTLEAERVGVEVERHRS